MLVKNVKRYYCEHCKKSGGSSYHMRIHEAHCTLNPERKCRMCSKTGSLHYHKVSDLIEILGDGFNINFDDLHDHVNGCPACILATIRQSPFIRKHREMINFDYEKYKNVYEFDFKESCRELWGNFNDSERYY